MNVNDDFCALILHRNGDPCDQSGHGRNADTDEYKARNLRFCKREFFVFAAFDGVADEADRRENEEHQHVEHDHRGARLEADADCGEKAH